MSNRVRDHLEESQPWLGPLRDILTEARIELMRQRGGNVSDNDLATWLGTSAASMNAWINGNRKPGYENILVMSRRLGPRVFDIFGYPPAYEVPDSVLGEIIRKFYNLDRTVQREVYELVTGKSIDDTGGDAQ